MARRALLIGTENYGKEFGRLEATPKNVLALADVLADPLMGGFEKPETLIDPDHSKMAETIETWLRSHTRDDFVLLYIAGHGVMDLKRKLYFAASSSRKVQDELVTSTAVSARNVHDWLQACKAKRQIVILDCCFSGAFGDLLAQDDGSVDVESVLGAEGRVVLTSSSSTQYSFQQREGKLSVYTTHLIEGITSGAADLDDDGKISTDELYQYTLRKVQEESPGMTPKMIVVKDAGYRLRIANTPMDAKVKYRKEVDLLVQKFGDVIKSLGRAKLRILQSNLELSDDEVRDIEFKVLEPIQLRKAKLLQYRGIFTEAVEEEYPFDDLHLQLLDEIKALLGFSDEDVAIVEAAVLAAVQPELRPKETVTIEFDRLEDLLQKKQWKEANDETLRLLLCLADRQAEDWLLVGNIRNFAQDDLNTIDALWSNASQGRFGFGIQARIFEEKIEPFEYLGQGELSKSEAWQEFDAIVKWRSEAGNSYEFSLNAPEGHLPHWRKLISGWNVRDRGISFLKRGLDCPIGSFQSIESEDIEVEIIAPEVQITSEVPLPKGDLGGSNWSWEESTFEFETAKVNDRGEVFDRKTDRTKGFRQYLDNDVFIDMVEISEGTFQGAKVEPFLMSKTPITQAQWEAVVKLKQKQINVELKSKPSRFEGANRPVERVNWWQAEEFCKRLSIVTQHDYRLPSEAQWEYACRSGTEKTFYFGDQLTNEVANYGKQVGETTDVEKYPANAWGFYDMHGNVWEWCADHWRDKLETPLKDSNPYLSDDKNARRLLRGGSWFDDPSRCGSACRLAGSPSDVVFYVGDLVGLRLVCSRSRTLS
jgi:formylglycine-generating enzyme required for sulfatase activity